MLRCGNDGILHVQETVVAVHRPLLIDTVGSLKFHAAVIYRAGVLVEHTRSVGIGQGDNQVLAVDVEDIYSVFEPSVQQRLRQGNFIVPHRLRLQIRILRGKHIHLTQDGITEAFGSGCLQFDGVRQVKGKSGLRNPLRADTRMVINAKSAFSVSQLQMS